MARTAIPTAGGNAKVAEHNLYDFRNFLPNTGNIWFVDSNGTAGTGLSPDSPTVTLGAAHSNATTNNDDVILVCAGHAESYTGAAGVTFSKGGCRVVGLGVGRKRPVFTFSTATAAQAIVTGANTTFQNLVFDFTGLDAITAAIAVDAADVTFENCEFITNSATAGVVSGITVGGTTTSPRFRLINCRFRGPATNAGTTTTAAVTLTDCPDFEIRDCFFTGKMTQAINNGAAILRGEIRSNRFVVYTGTKAINLHASSTALISSNDINVPSGTAPVVAAGAFVVRNAYSAAAGVTADEALTW